MIKGWKLNPEWVRLMDEKKKERLDRRVAGKMTVVGRDVLNIKPNKTYTLRGGWL